MRKIIHVHQQEIRKQDPINHPAIIVRTYKGSTHAREVKVLGPCILLHREEPDSCGARVSIETHAEVVADGMLI